MSFPINYNWVVSKKQTNKTSENVEDGEEKKKKVLTDSLLCFFSSLVSAYLLLCCELISLENEVAESRTKSADLVTLKRYLFRVWAKKTSRNNYKTCDVINIKQFLQGLQCTVGLLNPIPFIFPNIIQGIPQFPWFHFPGFSIYRCL